MADLPNGLRPRYKGKFDQSRLGLNPGIGAETFSIKKWDGSKAKKHILQHCYHCIYLDHWPVSCKNITIIFGLINLGRIRE